MGMLMYDALVLGRTAKEIANRRNCLMLGVPTLNFKAEHFFHQWNTHPQLKDFPLEPREFETAQDFFRLFGFEDVKALDISDYEGAEIVADLNDPGLPESLGQTFDLIYDSGTTEHIFDAPTALRSLSRLVNPGGAIVHSTPSNGFLDHGFWQISPDLYRTFYTKAGFDLLSSSLFVFADEPYALPAEINLYRTHGRKYVSRMAPEAMAVFAAIKMREGDLGPISLQEYYSLMHDEVGLQSSARFFLKFGHAPGEAIETQTAPIAKEANLFKNLWSKVSRLVG